jgi:hypothetical protein
MPSELNVISTKINEPIKVINDEEADLALKLAFQLYTYADFEKVANRVDFALKCFEKANDFVKAYNVFKHKNKQLELLKAKNKIKLEETENPSDEPTVDPSDEPTTDPSDEPTTDPSDEPTTDPSDEPTVDPSDEPNTEPDEPTTDPSDEPNTEPDEPEEEPVLPPFNPINTRYRITVLDKNSEPVINAKVTMNYSDGGSNYPSETRDVNQYGTVLFIIPYEEYYDLTFTIDAEGFYQEIIIAKEDVYDYDVELRYTGLLDDNVTGDLNINTQK